MTVWRELLHAVLLHAGKKQTQILDSMVVLLAWVDVIFPAGENLRSLRAVPPVVLAEACGQHDPRGIRFGIIFEH